MFENIGLKIMSLAKVITIVGIVSSAVLGIKLVLDGDVMMGLLISIGGILFSWVSSFTLYGFGQLIDDVRDIKTRTFIDSSLKDNQSYTPHSKFEE